MTNKRTISIDQLKKLEPITTLSEERLQELMPLSYTEHLGIGGNLFRQGDIDNQTVYLLEGDVQLTSSGGNIDKIISHKDQQARFPLDDSQPRQASCSALTRVEVVRIDNSVLDYMMMWDQMAVSEATAVASKGGTKFSRMRDPHVVATPRVQMTSLMASGMPSSGVSSPSARR